MTTAAAPPAEAPWRRLSPRMLLVHPVQEVVRAAPALLGLLIAGSNNGHGNLWALAGVAIAIGAGTLRWFTTRFRITPEQVQVRRGLLRRRLRAVSRGPRADRRRQREPAPARARPRPRDGRDRALGPQLRRRPAPRRARRRRGGRPARHAAARPARPADADGAAAAPAGDGARRRTRRRPPRPRAPRADRDRDRPPAPGVAALRAVHALRASSRSAPSPASRSTRPTTRTSTRAGSVRSATSATRSASMPVAGLVVVGARGRRRRRRAVLDRRLCPRVLGLPPHPPLRAGRCTSRAGC